MSSPVELGMRSRFLLDTNAFIALEPYAGSIEAGFAPAANFMQLAVKRHHRIFVHPASRDELGEAENTDRVAQRLAELSKFEMLEECPISSGLVALNPAVIEGTNDHRDLRILASLQAQAVQYLITDDKGLTKRAAKAGLAGQVLTIADAARLLSDREPSQATPPPRIVKPPAYALDLDQAIFDSLREDYPEFDEWIDKVRRTSEDRVCLVVAEDDGSYSAIAILKKSDSPPDGVDLLDPVSKICTFKVQEEHRGNRYGELLLKAIFNEHRSIGAHSTFLTVKPKHDGLIDILEQFGFSVTESETSGDELVMAKSYIPRAGDADLSALDYHRKLGPPAISPTAN